MSYYSDCWLDCCWLILCYLRESEDDYFYCYYYCLIMELSCYYSCLLIYIKYYNYLPCCIISSCNLSTIYFLVDLSFINCIYTYYLPILYPIDFTIYYYSFCFICCYNCLNWNWWLYYVLVIFYSYDEIMLSFYLCRRESYYWRVEIVDSDNGDDLFCWCWCSYCNSYCPLLTMRWFPPSDYINLCTFSTSLTFSFNSTCNPSTSFFNAVIILSYDLYLTSLLVITSNSILLIIFSLSINI